jgi:hypothetical protein
LHLSNGSVSPLSVSPISFDTSSLNMCNTIHSSCMCTLSQSLEGNPPLESAFVNNRAHSSILFSSSTPQSSDPPPPPPYCATCVLTPVHPTSACCVPFTHFPYTTIAPPNLTLPPLLPIPPSPSLATPHTPTLAHDDDESMSLTPVLFRVPPVSNILSVESIPIHPLPVVSNVHTCNTHHLDSDMSVDVCTPAAHVSPPPHYATNAELGLCDPPPFNEEDKFMS